MIPSTQSDHYILAGAGTIQAFTSQMRTHGFSGRYIGNATLDSMGCEGFSLADLMINGGVAGSFDNLHLELTQPKLTTATSGSGTVTYNTSTTFPTGTIYTGQKFIVSGYTDPLLNGSFTYSGSTSSSITLSNSSGHSCTGGSCKGTVQMLNAYGTVIGWDDSTSNLSLNNQTCSSGVGTCVLIANNSANSNSWAPVTDISIRNLAELLPNTQTLVDQQNSNTLTNANNPTVPFYEIDNGGAVFTDANPNELTNGVDVYGDNISIYSNGSTPTFEVTGANGTVSVQGHSGITAGPLTSVTSVAVTGGIVTTLTGSSDMRLKTDLQPYRRGLDDILRIHPKLYHWNEEGQRITKIGPDVEQAGFIAQDIQQAIPEAVGKETDDGAEYLTVNDRPIIAALVNAIKEEQAEISTLKKEIDELKARIP